MNIIPAVTLFLIAAGAMIMAINIKKSRATLRLLYDISEADTLKMKALFRAHEILMCFFLLGYCVVAGAIITDIHLFSELFVGVIFFFGAVFVLLGINLQTKMILAIKRRYDQVLATSEELRQANTGLAQAITQVQQTEKKNITLEQRLARAQRMEALGLLAGGVAHDLNNVLTGAVTYPDLILLELAEDHPLRELILTIQDSGKKAAAIVQDLLTLARRSVTSTKVVDFNELINRYLASPEHKKILYHHSNVECTIALDPAALPIIGSEVHLTTTLMNLVSNAAEAMISGGQIKITTENINVNRPRTGFEEVESGDYVILTVEDAGEGISPLDIDRIFEPFYTKKVMGRSGTGLGMSVVWGTVQDHKGHIFVESTLSVGTTFRIFFPATHKPLSPTLPPRLIEDLKGEGEHLLVVDDVAKQREIAEHLLTKLNYIVYTVASGEQAITFLESHQVDLLILDMIMDPGIDGLETYQRVLATTPGQKAIITSGFSETERVKEAMMLGAGQYIQKPYTLESLGVAVMEELKKKSAP